VRGKDEYFNIVSNRSSIFGLVFFRDLSEIYSSYIPVVQERFHLIVAIANVGNMKPKRGFVSTKSRVSEEAAGLQGASFGDFGKERAICREGLGRFGWFVS
jgi:hypothetical protein